MATLAPPPEWCNRPHCDCFNRLEIPGLEVVLGCYQKKTLSIGAETTSVKLKMCQREGAQEVRVRGQGERGDHQSKQLCGRHDSRTQSNTYDGGHTLANTIDQVERLISSCKLKYSFSTSNHYGHILGHRVSQGYLTEGTVSGHT